MEIHLSSGPVSLGSIPGFCRFSREVTPGAYLIGFAFGVSAGTLIALGVPPIEIANGDERGIDDDVSAEFIDPSSLLDDEAA